jgi:hypothetical protein
MLFQFFFEGPPSCTDVAQMDLPVSQRHIKDIFMNPLPTLQTGQFTPVTVVFPVTDWGEVISRTIRPKLTNR